jgi:hypothetical protein
MRTALAALFAIGCSNHAGSGDDVGPPADASTSSIELACESGGATFPPLEKACSVAADCFIALHTKNCCGTQVAIGLNQTSYVAFTTAEGSCDAAYPGCGCAQFPTTAEDGRTEDLGTIQVRCDLGLCTTFIP